VDTRSQEIDETETRTNADDANDQFAAHFGDKHPKAVDTAFKDRHVSLTSSNTRRCCERVGDRQAHM
jgi:hypothetical protein